MGNKVFKERLEKLLEVAKAFGLDGFPVVVEPCSADILAGLAASGIPGRFEYWGFGKAYEFYRTSYACGSQRLYELILYTDPCCAFILDECASGEQLLLLAHILAHSDFFKNNAYFQSTLPPKIELFSRHAEAIGEYEKKYGYEVMENFLDAVLSIKEYCGNSFNTEKDLLGFLFRESPVLAPWQRRMLGFIKDEMRSFWPQIETRFLNEGWAAFWHQRLLAECSLTAEEVVEVSRLHAQLLAPNGLGLNPYRIGLRLLNQIFEEEGLKTLFSIRTLHNDLSFMKRYLRADLLQELDLYLYSVKDGACLIVETDPLKVKDVFLSHLENGGYPVISIADANYGGRRELYLKHHFNGLELAKPRAEQTLAYLTRLWGSPVYLETIIGGQTRILEPVGSR